MLGQGLYWDVFHEVRYLREGFSAPYSLEQSKRPQKFDVSPDWAMRVVCTVHCALAVTS